MTKAMIRLRKAQLSDIPLLVSLEAEYARDQRNIVLQENPRLRPYLARRAGTAPHIARWLRKCIRSRNTIVFIAEDQGRTVGFSVASIVTNPPIRKLRQVGNIDVLFVKRAYRGRKVSSMMMKASLEWFRKRKIRHVGLEVMAANRPASSIYRKWGLYDFFVVMRMEI